MREKKLVAFFSATGVTAGVAKRLADIIGADLYEIKPYFPYSEEDLDWKDKRARSRLEMQVPEYRPAIGGAPANIEEYSTIFLGFPIWGRMPPTIINTFLEGYDFAGKTIIPFATSGGRGVGKTYSRLIESCPTAKLLEVKLFASKETDKELQVWVKRSS